MKVLIIGAKGMLGQALAREFEAGNEILAWDREDIDITDAQSVKRKVQSVKPDLVINSAAYTSVDKAEEEVELANQINGHAVGILAGICRELDSPLVHFSTEYVFDGESKQGYDELARPNPISAYGASKFLGEQELQRNTDKFYLIRLSRLFGGKSPSPLSSPVQGEERDPTPSPLAGEGGGEGASRKKSFVSLMLELAKTKKEIEVVDEELSCLTYATDLAKLTRQIIDQKLPFGIYHGANSGACTWYGFAKEIFKIAGIDVKLIPVPASRFARPAKRPPFGILLNTKLPKQRRWQEALFEFLKSEARSTKSETISNDQNNKLQTAEV